MRSLGDEPLSAMPGNASRNTSDVFSLFDVRDTLSVASTRSPIDGVMVHPRPTEASGERIPSCEAPAPNPEEPPNMAFPRGGAADKPDAVLGGVVSRIWANAVVEASNIRLAIAQLESKRSDGPEQVEVPVPERAEGLRARADRASTSSARTEPRMSIVWRKEVTEQVLLFAWVSLTRRSRSYRIRSTNLPQSAQSC